MCGAGWPANMPAVVQLMVWVLTCCCRCLCWPFVVCSTALNEGVGAAIHANSSTVMLANSTVTQNTGTNMGGCAIKATQSKGVVLAGCTFGGNMCYGDGGAIVGGNYAASTCIAGGASLMVTSNMPPFQVGNATQCSNAAANHLVHISDSSFDGDVPTPWSCGGSIMLGAAWLELHRSNITGNAPASMGGALASSGSAIVLQDARISNVSSIAYGGSIFQLRGRFWASGSQFLDGRTEKEGGGCVYITGRCGAVA